MTQVTNEINGVFAEKSESGEGDVYCHYGEPDSEGKPVVALLDRKGRRLDDHEEHSGISSEASPPYNGETEGNVEYPDYSMQITSLCYEQLNDFVTIDLTEETFNCILDALIWVNPMQPGYYGPLYKGGGGGATDRAMMNMPKKSNSESLKS